MAGVLNALDHARLRGVSARFAGATARIALLSEIGEQERVRFTLAAYNCGPGHVADGRRMAADLKLDPNRRFGHVEKAMPLLAKPRFARTAQRRVLPVRRADQVRHRDPAPLRVLFEPDRPQLTTVPGPSARLAREV